MKIFTSILIMVGNILLTKNAHALINANAKIPVTPFGSFLNSLVSLAGLTGVVLIVIGIIKVKKGGAGKIIGITLRRLGVFLIISTAIFMIYTSWVLSSIG